MTTIEINNKEYSVPQNWNELSPKQLLQVIDVLYKKDYDINEATVLLLKIITGMSWWAFFKAPVTTCERYKFRRKNLRFKLNIVQAWAEFLYLSKVECTGLDEYLYLSDFLINNNHLTKNLLPKYKGFYGPADEMQNLVMEEFVFSESYYMLWCEKEIEEGKKVKALNNLVAVLYRPGRTFYNRKKNAKGDIRIAFNENLCSYYADRDVINWPLNVKMAIVHHYQACREKFITDNPDVFSGSGEPSEYGLVSIMRGVAKSGVHGDTIDKVGKIYVNAILMELNELVIEARKHEQAMKAIS